MLLLGATVLAVCVPVFAHAEWSENFDSYANGSGVIGQGGWEGWDNNPAADAYVTDVQSLSAPHSVDITPTTDLIHQFSDYTSGQWVVTAWQYIPSTATGDQYFILLNTYNHGGPYNWSLQVLFSGGFVTDPDTGAQLSMHTDQWVEIRVEIDLDADLQTVYYGGDQLVQKSWTDGVSGDGAVNIACIDLYSAGAADIYYDDLSIEEPGATPVENTSWGRIKSLF
jgi:hypothetical protein